MNANPAKILNVSDKHVKNFAVAYKEAVVQLGKATREVSPGVPEAYAEKMNQLLEGLERMYWTSDALERQAHQTVCHAENSQEMRHDP